MICNRKICRTFEILAAFWIIGAIPVGAAVAGAGLTPIACEELPWKPRDPAFAALPGARAFFGAYSGGLYQVEIPEAWNGQLVLWAHGWRDSAPTEGKELRVSSPVQVLRQHMIEKGYAWAASSYRCNGYVPGMGLVDTMALKEIFVKTNDGKTPSRTYLVGNSMGGHLTILGMQEFPNDFDGGLAMCPAGPGEFGFLVAAGAAFEAISGVPLAEIAKEEGTARLDQLLGKSPSLTQFGLQLASVQIKLSGGPRPFAMQGLASQLSTNVALAARFPNSHALSAWYSQTSNSKLEYSIDENLGLTEEELNARVPRKAVDARAGKGPYEETMAFDGQIQKPLLTLHGLGDLFVPVSLERELKSAMDAAGTSSLLVQRLVRVAGHCGFSGPEMIRAFDDMVQWVRSGQRPDGDDVMGDFKDAGRKFTDPIRPDDPGELQP